MTMQWNLPYSPFLSQETRSSSELLQVPYIFYFSEPASHYKQDGECLYGLCECDADAANCFAKYEDKYNEKFKFYPKVIC